MKLPQLLERLGYNPNYATALNPKDQFIHEAMARAQERLEGMGMTEDELSLVAVQWFRQGFLICLQIAMSDVQDMEVQLQVAREQEQVLQKLASLNI